LRRYSEAAGKYLHIGANVQITKTESHLKTNRRDQSRNFLTDWIDI